MQNQNTTKVRAKQQLHVGCKMESALIYGQQRAAASKTHPKRYPAFSNFILRTEKSVRSKNLI